MQQERARNPEVQKKIEDTVLSAKIAVDMDPALVPDDELSCIMKPYTKPAPKRSRNFTTYYGGEDHDRKEIRVRVNGKFYPKDTGIAYADYMKRFVKTTMVKSKGSDTWKCIEDRC